MVIVAPRTTVSLFSVPPKKVAPSHYRLRHRRTSRAAARQCSQDNTFINVCIDSGMTIFQNGDFAPPDPNGAAGLNLLIAVTNKQIEGLRKDGTTVFGPTPLWTFFSTFNLQNAFDPKVLYDFQADRFIVIALDNDSKGVGSEDSETPITVSRIVIAVSKNGDPTSTGESDWYYHEINAFVDNRYATFLVSPSTTRSSTLPGTC